MTKKRRQFTREFKIEAVRLVPAGGRTIAQVALDLGIGQNVLQRWKKQFAADPDHAFPAQGHLKPGGEEMEVCRLRLENARLMKEHGIRAKQKRKFKVAADSKHSLLVAPNRLAAPRR